jgi:hypothetical protein
VRVSAGRRDRRRRTSPFTLPWVRHLAADSARMYVSLCPVAYRTTARDHLSRLSRNTHDRAEVCTAVYAEETGSSRREQPPHGCTEALRANGRHLTDGGTVRLPTAGDDALRSR